MHSSNSSDFGFSTVKVLRYTVARYPIIHKKLQQNDHCNHVNMKPKFLHEHNIEHSRSKMSVLQCSIICKIEP